MKSMEIKIDGMSCNHCVETVERTLKGIGVSAKVSLEKKNAKLEFDENKVSLDKIKAAIDEAGYQAS